MPYSNVPYAPGSPGVGVLLALTLVKARNGVSRATTAELRSDSHLIRRSVGSVGRSEVKWSVREVVTLAAVLHHAALFVLLAVVHGQSRGQERKEGGDDGEGLHVVG